MAKVTKRPAGKTAGKEEKIVSKVIESKPEVTVVAGMEIEEQFLGVPSIEYVEGKGEVITFDTPKKAPAGWTFSSSDRFIFPAQYVDMQRTILGSTVDTERQAYIAEQIDRIEQEIPRLQALLREYKKEQITEQDTMKLVHKALYALGVGREWSPDIGAYIPVTSEHFKNVAKVGGRATVARTYKAAVWQLEELVDGDWSIRDSGKGFGYETQQIRPRREHVETRAYSVGDFLAFFGTDAVGTDMEVGDTTEGVVFGRQFRVTLIAKPATE